MEIQYQFGDFPAVTQVFSSLNIAPYTVQSLTFDELTDVPPGTYMLSVKILKINDVDFDVVVEKEIYVATQETERFVTIEHFTSSTCGPCVSPNAQMKTLLEANPDKFGISKYQMNWPGSGDPYYTEEGGVRRSYYGVNSVPEIYFNAKKIASVNQTTFDDALAEPAFIDIDGVFTMDGSNITANIEILPYITTPNVRLYAVVNEKQTLNNTGSNGETQFIHVMMKILPDAQGETISMVAGERLTFEYTYDMSTTNVEEFDDLEVHVFVQNYETQYIFNSKFLCDAPVEAPQSVELVHASTDIIVNWQAVSGADRYAVFFNGTLLAQNITETTFTHEDVEDGLHTYGVIAFVGNCQSPMTESTIDFVDLQAYKQDYVKIYPNPTNGFVTIEASNMNRITAINTLGQVVCNIDVNGTNVERLDVSQFEAGVYVLRIAAENGISTKRITIVK